MFAAIILVICSAITLGFGYLIQPAWTFASSSLPWVIFFGLVVFSLGIAAIVNHYDWEGYAIAIALILTGVVFIAIIVISLVGSPVFNSNPYRDAVEIKEASFTEDFDDLASIEDYHLLDLDTARRLGDRVLGTVPNAPWYNVSDEYNLIVYQGKQYRISPLEYRDIFAYLKAKDTGIPGYVLVSVDTMEAEFIQTDPIKVSPSGCFAQKLSRVLRGQYPGYIFDQSFMEIDETGHPYWITAVLQPHAGLWGAPVVKGYVITDANTVESQYYGIEEAKPDWLDHVYSLEYMMNRASWKYGYVHGWWNISGTDVHNLTYAYKTSANTKEGIPAFHGYNCFVNKEGHVVVITGVTPSNKTESNVGFLTIDCSTGEYKYYAIPGAEESSAQDVVEGIIQQMKYESTFPVMINIGGEPAYLMNLKDKSGLIQRYAIVNYRNYSKAFVGETFDETMDGYLKIIGKKQEEPVIEEPETLTTTGVIQEKYQGELQGSTVFYYVIDGKWFESSLIVNKEQFQYTPGMTVEISYEESDGNVNIVTEIVRK